MTTIAPSYLLVDYLVGLSSSILDLMVDQDSSYGRMIFRDACPLRLEQTGKRAITVSNQPGTMYGGYSPYGNTVAFRLYSDHSRDAEGLASVEDGVDRAWAMYGFLDKLINDGVTLRSGDPMVQVHRISSPLETFDPDLNVPYIAVNYDVAVLVSV